MWEEVGAFFSIGKNKELILIFKFILDWYTQENAQSKISSLPKTLSKIKWSWVVQT